MTRQQVKRMTVAQRLAAHRGKVSRQERAAVDLLRLMETAQQEIELDGLENLVARAVATGTITPGRAAGIRGMLRGRRRKLARREVANAGKT